MARVYLIRHGRPASSWGGADDDPGLDSAGRAQAEAAAQALLALPPEQRPTRVVSSPLRRCRETAAPLARALGVEVEIDPAVGEVPTPRNLDHAVRSAWLQKAFGGRWSDVEGDLDYESWRRAVARAVGARGGSAVFSHYVAINAVVSLLTGDDRVVTFRPDHCSMTVLEAGQEGLSLVQRGPEAATGVL